LFYIHMIVWY